MLEAIQSIDFAVLNWIHENLTCRALDVFFSFITHFGDAGLFWIGVGIVMLFVKRFRKAGICLLIAISLGFLVSNLILKPWVARTRPYDINTALQLLISRPSDFSFPSGHTTASIASALAIFYHHKKLGSGALTLAVLIALSRLYLYVHFPTDVLVGAMVGTLASIAAWALVNKAFPRYMQRRAARASVQGSPSADGVQSPSASLVSEDGSQD